MRLAVLAATATLLLLPLARADVMPAPEEINEIQQQLIGTWQQNEVTGMLGHGEGLETMLFDKERYVIVAIHAVSRVNIYSISQDSGEWEAQEQADGTLKLTLYQGGRGTPGSVPHTLTYDVRFTGPDTMIVPKSGRGSTDVVYTRVYPKAAP